MTMNTPTTPFAAASHDELISIYREQITEMANTIQDETFLLQIYSIMKRHIQRTGV